jgi:hypothetical protein
MTGRRVSPPGLGFWGALPKQPESADKANASDVTEAARSVIATVN